MITDNIKLTKPGTYLSMGCIHVPFENKKMLNSLYSLLEKEGVVLSGVILAGDVLDLNSLSSHSKGMVPMPGITLGKEYKAGAAFIRDIESLSYIKKATYSMLYGNHCDRYFREMSRIDQSKISDSIPMPHEGMQMDDKWTVQTDWKNAVIQIGSHLDIFHGEFYNVHVAKTTLDKNRRSCLFYHSHRFQVHADGEHSAVNGGCAINIQSPAFSYATKSMKKSWTNAVQLIHLDKHGYYHIQNLIYFKDSFWVNGRRY